MSLSGLHQEIPFFDPLDGDVNARCLFVAEAPGPRAVLSGFVSRDNPSNGLPSPPAGECVMQLFISRLTIIHRMNRLHEPSAEGI